MSRPYDDWMIKCHIPFCHAVMRRARLKDIVIVNYLVTGISVLLLMFEAEADDSESCFLLLLLLLFFF